MILQATGTIDLDELAFSYWFSLDAIPTSVTSTCPADHFVAKQLALSTGGADRASSASARSRTPRGTS